MHCLLRTLFCNLAVAQEYAIQFRPHNTANASLDPIVVVGNSNGLADDSYWITPPSLNPTPVLLPAANSSFTLEAWIKINSFAATYFNFIGCYSQPEPRSFRGFQLGMNEDANFIMRREVVGIVTLTTDGGALPRGAWVKGRWCLCVCGVSVSV